MLPAERCYLVGVEHEKVDELFQVCYIYAKKEVFYSFAQYSLLYHKSL